MRYKAENIHVLAYLATCTENMTPRAFPGAYSLPQFYIRDIVYFVHFMEQLPIMMVNITCPLD